MARSAGELWTLSDEMKVTIHDGSFSHHSVQVELVTQDPRIRRRVSRAYGGEPKTWMSVFAGSLEDVARRPSPRSKWLRHQDLTTDRVAQTVHEDGEPAS